MNFISRRANIGFTFKYVYRIGLGSREVKMIDRDKLKELDKNLKKKCPEANLRYGNDKDLIVKKKSTGIFVLDNILGGGLPVARTVLVVGNFAAGKTRVTQEFIKEGQKRKEICLYVDVEGCFEPAWWRQVGIDLSTLIVSQPSSGEVALQIVIDAINEGVDLVVLDSVAALIPTAEIESNMEKSGIGEQARLFNKGLRKITNLNLQMGKTTFVAVNQTRSAIGTGPFLAESLPGGKGQQFFASIILRVMRGKWVEEKDEKVGFELRLKTEKNKLASWPQECDIPFLFSGLFDVPAMVLDLSLERGLIKLRDKAYYTIGKEEIFGRRATIKYLGENPDVLDQLKKEVFSTDIPEEVVNEEIIVEEIGGAEPSKEDEPKKAKKSRGRKRRGK